MSPYNASTDDHQLSPSNGYFASSPAPSSRQRVSISSPTQAESDSHNARSHSYNNNNDEVGNGNDDDLEAPPAYTSTASFPFIFEGPGAKTRSYRTFDHHGGSLTRSPECMGPPPPPLQEARHSQPSDSFPHRTSRWPPTWCHWKTIVLTCLLMAVCASFLTSALRASSSNHRPGPGATPPHASRPGDVGGASFCPHASNHKGHWNFPLDFSGDNVSFRQKTHGSQPGHHRTVLVGGQANVRRFVAGGPPGQRGKAPSVPGFELRTASNIEDLKLEVDFDPLVQKLVVNVPRSVEWSPSGHEPCIQISLELWVPEDAVLGNLDIDVVHLDIELWDDLSVKVNDLSRFSSIIGNIVSECLYYHPSSGVADDLCGFDSPRIEASTTSGDITGNFALYDVLRLQTSSGDIMVEISPQEERDSNKPKPASLAIETTSGVIRATQPILRPDVIPHRDYIVKIDSTSGNIQGKFAFGSEVTVKTISSAADIELLPVLDQGAFSPEKPARLETKSTSGVAHFQVLEPVWFARGESGKAASSSSSSSRPLDALRSTHRSTSGNLSLLYPQSWEGKLKADSMSGKLEVRGKDVRIIGHSGWPGRKVEAVKGAGGAASTIEVSMTVGNVEAQIGDKE